MSAVTTSTTFRSFVAEVEADPAQRVPLDDARAQAQLDEQAEQLRADVLQAQRAGHRYALALLLSEACGKHAITGELFYTADDVLGWFRRADEMECNFPGKLTARAVACFRLEQVPNARLREAYLDYVADGKAEGVLATLAHALGAVSNGRPDVSYVNRLLGLIPQVGKGDSAPSLRLFVDYGQALVFADQLGLDYHDLGV